MLGLFLIAYADEDSKHSGVETSAEHQSEQGAEHGTAYAGTKEKKKDVVEEEDEEEEGDKVKKEKKAKKEK